MADTTVLVEDLYFPEGPRWRDSSLYFSDFYGHRVLRTDLDGNLTTVCTVEQQPSGLGWLPDGSMLIVSMIDRKVLRLDTDHQLHEYADLSHIATFHCNDMLVDDAGRAYVGNFGFDLDEFMDTYGVAGLLGEPGPTATSLAMILPDQSVELAMSDLVFPNGVVLTRDRQTMIIAETLAMRLTAFDVDERGRLSNRRIWADLSAQMMPPDGIAIDGHDHVWIANALAPQAALIAEGGEVVQTVETSQTCFAVALGGPEGTTLACCTAADSHHVAATASATGKIEIATVDCPAQPR